MSNSLRAEITHLFKKGKITRPEYDWFMKKAYGHDDVIKKIAYQQGRADVLREHREQCQGKCFKCEVSVPFVNSDGEEVILPYSYSYKTDCEDNRYINAKEVLSLIKQSRADAIDEFAKLIHEDLYQLNHHQVDFLAEYLKSQYTDEREIQNMLLFKDMVKERKNVDSDKQ